jgi:hypothetical protein
VRDRAHAHVQRVSRAAPRRPEYAEGTTVQLLGEALDRVRRPVGGPVVEHDDLHRSGVVLRVQVPDGAPDDVLGITGHDQYGQRRVALIQVGSRALVLDQARREEHREPPREHGRDDHEAPRHHRADTT